MPALDLTQANFTVENNDANGFLLHLNLNFERSGPRIKQEPDLIG